MVDVRKGMATMKEALRSKAPTIVNELIQRTDHPFIIEVMAQPLSDKFKLPQMEMFDGGRDPLDYLEAYKTYMSLQVALDEMICWAFPTTIKGLAKVWFSLLKPGSMSNLQS